MLSLILAAQLATVERHPNPENPQAVIVPAVGIPAGAEWLLLSGQVPRAIDPARPATTVADYGDTYTQAMSTFTRIDGILKARGWGMRDVVRLTVYLVADPATGRMDFDGLNRAYRQWFGTAANPHLVARSTVEISALAAPGLLVEIEATAARMPRPR